ncbi:flagellar hook-associated protein FlgK [Paracoccus sp. (in: a-proteobacteria)]|uniref:flagellar hook-associated protein FlgK n=1 Tax=Paracoccus sp. TaxID=267 RepID=UPI003A89DBDB
MSITKALSNAVSGLTATARGTETVAANLANVMTPGYARREMAISAQTLGGAGGGVRIDGITRIVNAGLLAETRLAGSAQTEVATRLTFAKSMEQVVGLPGDRNGLGTALTEFRAALSEASTRPDDEIRLSSVLTSATSLAQRLNGASAAVQAQRSDASQAIALDVRTLNGSLDRVAYLNRRISIISAQGGDTSSLKDERQTVIDRINTIVPIQEIPREAGKVALFSAEGAVLLDGSIPSGFQIQTPGHMTPGMQVGSPSVGRLIINGEELTASQMRLFSGGTLSANLSIRDELAPELQRELDSLAQELHDRMASPGVDPTLAGGDPGLFTDAGTFADPADIVGLSGRIAVNSAVDPKAGGELWRLRGGLQATSPGPVGDPAQLFRLSDALDRVTAPPGSSAFDGNGTLTQRFATLESRVSSRRISLEADSAIRNSRAETITGRFLDDGVSSDTEMQNLLQYEQAYAANARVIQTIDAMLDQILRL